MPQQQYPQRHQLYLPERIADRLAELAAQNGVPRSYLAYLALVDAARLAQAGLGHLLPQEKKSPKGVGRVVRVPWTQSNAEYERCEQLIVSAGSTPTAAFRSWAEAYDASGGDPLAPAWTPKSGSVAVA